MRKENREERRGRKGGRKMGREGDLRVRQNEWGEEGWEGKGEW